MSLFRKLLKSNPKEDGNVNQFAARPTNVQTMGASLQRKFARGVQYNMKIVIRGDRNVGKTCLFERLQGQAFKEEYIPTDEIQVASIHWNYKTTDDVVKVEVWDIVDKGRKKKKLDGLKLENDIPTAEEPILDADFLDVYKGTHGVLMMLDMTKSWTLDYVEREVPLVPFNVPILILANHRDMGHHRTISADQVKTFIENLGRPSDAAQVRYTETSMRSAFGLKYVHRFFSLPFLQLQRETLLKQLETNARDINTIVEELECIEESEDSNYDAFRSQLLTARDNRKAASAATSPTSPVDLPSPSSPQPGSQDKGRIHAPPARPIPGMEAYLRGIAAQQPKPTSETVSKPPPTGDKPEVPNQRPTTLHKDKEVSKSSPAISSKSSHSAVVKHDVDDFIPDEAGGLTSFLDDTAVEATTLSHAPIRREEDSSSEDDGNPMVAGFQEDIDLEDEKPAPVRTPVVASRHLEMSTDEEDDEEEEEVAIPIESVSRKSSSRDVPDQTLASTNPSNNSQQREMSSSGYTSASSEKPGMANGLDIRASAPQPRDVDSSEEEEDVKVKAKKSSRSSARRKSQPSTMEEEKEADEVEEKSSEEKVLPTIVLDTSDFDFLERRGSSSTKVSSSIVTPSESDVFDDSSSTKKSKKHRREKDGDAPPEDQEKRKSKKQKKRAVGEEDEGKKSRKKSSHRSHAPDDETVNGSVKKSKKKTKRKTAAVDDSPLDGNSDLERFLNDSNTASTGGAYEVL